MKTALKKKDKAFLLQFLRFGLVGVSNTLITALVVALLLKVLHMGDFVANSIGYAAGLVNSFVWNRRWTFRSKSQVKDTLFRFMLIFAVSYAVQWAFVALLLRLQRLDDYWCHLAGMAVYAILNFLLNKFYTFKNR